MSAGPTVRVLVPVGMLGGGFPPDDLLAEVRETAAYEHLSDENWTWVLDFIRRGGCERGAARIGQGLRNIEKRLRGVIEMAGNDQGARVAQA